MGMLAPFARESGTISQLDGLTPIDQQRERKSMNPGEAPSLWMRGTVMVLAPPIHETV
jgi:hypothetical protein